MSSPRHALVIGGTGFISQYAVEELHSAGYIVSIITRGTTPDLHGDLVASRIKVNCDRRADFIATLQKSLATIHHEQKLESAPSQWDLVVDFICFDALHASDVVEGLAGICKIFVQISTDSIYEVCEKPTDGCYKTPYGRTENWCSLLKLPESKLLDLDDYGYKKFLCEKVFRQNVSRLPFIALRLPDVLGEREWPRSRHNQYQTRIQLGLPIYVNPSKHLPPSVRAEKRISFVYAGDVAKAVVACGRAVIAAEDEKFANSANGTNNTEASNALAHLTGQGINIGCVESLTLRQYVNFIGKVLGVPVFTFVSCQERVAAFAAAKEYRNSAQFKNRHIFASGTNQMPDGYYNPVSLASSYSILSRVVLSQLGLRLPPRDITLARLIQLTRGRKTNSSGYFIEGEVNTEVKWRKGEAPWEFAKLLQARDVEISSSSSSSSDSTSDIDSSSDSNSDAHDEEKKQMEMGCDGVSAIDKMTRFVERGLTRAEEREEDDKYSYLPSVDQGHIDTRRSEKLLPGYTNTDVWTFLQRMIIWYAHEDVMKYLETDALSLVKKYILKTQFLFDKPKKQKTM